MFVLSQVRYKNLLNIDRLHIPAEQVTCIVGESGAGKTTLLKLLNHMITCDEGTITYRGKSLDDWHPVALRREVVMSPQQPVLFGDTIRDNLLIGLKFSEQSPADDERLKAVLNLVLLDKNLDENAGTLSGGERQRLALARVILMDPPVYLLDEPTSMLDDDLEHGVMKRFIAYAKANRKTVVIVTHSKAVAQHFADQIVDITAWSRKGGERRE